MAMAQTSPLNEIRPKGPIRTVLSLLLADRKLLDSHPGIDFHVIAFSKLCKAFCRRF